MEPKDSVHPSAQRTNTLCVPPSTVTLPDSTVATETQMSPLPTKSEVQPVPFLGPNPRAVVLGRPKVEHTCLKQPITGRYCEQRDPYS
jgi:hypothetical protein